MTRQSEEEYCEEKENMYNYDDEKQYDQIRKEESRAITFKIASENYRNDVSFIAKHNTDGTVGRRSSKNEWLLSKDKNSLVWSGKTFIAT